MRKGSTFNVQRSANILELSPVEVLQLSTWAVSLARRVLPTKTNRKRPLVLDRRVVEASPRTRVLSTAIERVK